MELFLAIVFAVDAVKERAQSLGKDASSITLEFFDEGVRASHNDICVSVSVAKGVQI